MKNPYKVCTSTEHYIPLERENYRIIWNEGSFWIKDMADGEEELLDFSIIPTCNVPNLLKTMIKLYEDYGYEESPS